MPTAVKEMIEKAKSQVKPAEEKYYIE